MEKVEIGEWAAEMQEASDEKLMSYIDDYYNYQPEVVYSALKECECRNIFVDETRRMEIKRNVPDPWDMNTIAPSRKFDEYVTADPDAVVLYSQRAIFWCTVLFSPVFGAVMLASNIKRIGRTTGRAEIILLALFYLGATIWLMTLLPRGIYRFSGEFFSLLGAYFLQGHFWNKYVGSKTVYRKRSVAYPVLLGLLLPILALLVFIFIDLFFLQRRS